MEFVLYLITAILLGGAIGAGINVLATRLPADLPLRGPALWSGSKDEPGDPNPRWHIPYLGARDPESGAIDWPNLGTQLGAALVSAAALYQHGFSLAGLEAIVLAAVLLTILRIDWQHHLIFMLTIWPGIFIALVFSLVTSPGDLVSSAIAGLAAAAAFLGFYFLAILIYKQRALGLGDVFLAGLIGTMVGLEFILQTILLGMMAGALGGLFLVAIKVRTRRDYIPYGAYLSLAAIFFVLFTA